jgi:hypothetical protein
MRVTLGEILLAECRIWSGSFVEEVEEAAGGGRRKTREA